MSSTDADTQTSAPLPLVGRVKWFNNKSGFGFITGTEGSQLGVDIFVHHSDIQVSSDQYKYLVQGEYVEFQLAKSATEGHEFQAVSVLGVKGGKLMCETRNESRNARNSYKSSRVVPVDEVDQSSEAVVMPRQQAAPSSRPTSSRTKKVILQPEVGKSKSDDKKEWTTIEKTSVKKRRVPTAAQKK